MARILIFGASRGLGAAFSLALPSTGDMVWLVSRGQPDVSMQDGAHRLWIEADLAERDSATTIARAIGDSALDLAIYNAGIWEHNAFRPTYDIADVEDDTRDPAQATPPMWPPDRIPLFPRISGRRNSNSSDGSTPGTKPRQNLHPRLPRHLERESVVERDLLEAVEPAGSAAVAALHVGLQQHHVR